MSIERINEQKRPSIALISGDFPPTLSGIGDYTEKLAGALHGLGADVTVITSRVQTTDGSALPTTPYPVRREMPGWLFGNRQQLLDMLSEFDIAHIQYPSGAYGRGMMINALPHLIARHCPATRSLVTIHDFRVMRWRWRARVAPMLWGVNGLVHVDPKDGPWLKSWMPLRNAPTQVIPIAANAEPVPATPGDRARWRSELGFADDETVVAFFGVLYPHKGLPELHSAIQRFDRAAAVCGCWCWVILTGRRNGGRASSNSSASRRWCGCKALLSTAVSECLHAADLAALPFHSGASTNRGSMLATLAHGLPTVTTNGPCTPPELSQMFDLSLVPIQSAEALTSAIEALLDQPAVAARMKAAALNVMAKMSWPAVARSTLDFYETLLTQRRARRGAA